MSEWNFTISPLCWTPAKSFSSKISGLSAFIKAQLAVPCKGYLRPLSADAAVQQDGFLDQQKVFNARTVIYEHVLEPELVALTVIVMGDAPSETVTFKVSPAPNGPEGIVRLIETMLPLSVAVILVSCEAAL
jgi:hypothetical protein